MTPHLYRVGLVLVIGLASVLTTLLSLALFFAERRGWLVRSRFAIVSGRLAGGVVAISAACFLWALFIEAEWLEVTHETVFTAKWPKGQRLRLAHVSDLHVDRDSRALTRLTRVLEAEQVDLVVFTGDSINELGATKLFRTTLGGLPSRFGRVAVRGNHDVFRWAEIDLFGGGVATELVGKGPLILQGGALAVCGAAFGKYDTLPDCLAGAPKGAFVILAYHSPDLVEAIDPKPDLYLAGHTHGGQVALPGYGALVTFSAFDKKYEAGRYEVGPITLLVNRGVGFEPFLPRIRFWARPELSLVDVVGQ
jgi:predicted MPP superfamily phosphohydrolase